MLAFVLLAQILEDLQEHHYEKYEHLLQMEYLDQMADLALEQTIAYDQMVSLQTNWQIYLPLDFDLVFPSF